MSDFGATPLHSALYDEDGIYNEFIFDRLLMHEEGWGYEDLFFNRSADVNRELKVHHALRVEGYGVELDEFAFDSRQ